MLCRRFVDKRTVLTAHLDSIAQASVLEPGNGPMLRRFVAQVEEDIVGLQLLRLNLSSWDPLFVYFVYKKLDSDTRRACEIEYPGTDSGEVLGVAAIPQGSCADARDG